MCVTHILCHTAYTHGSACPLVQDMICKSSSIMQAEVLGGVTFICNNRSQAQAPATQ